MSNQPGQQEETIPMQDTPVPPFFAALTADERAQLFTDAHLRTLPGALAAIPDPRKRRGHRYDLPFLLTCLVAALLCDCNSLEAVGRWTRDQQALLTRVCGRRRHCTPTGSLYRRLLPRLSVAHVERALGSWVQQTRPLRDREPLSFDGKTVRGARTAAQAAPHLLSVSTHTTHETLVQVRVDDKTNEIPVAQELLPHLALRGRVVTADALHTQTALAQLLLDQGAAYLFTVKDNQPRLRADIEKLFEPDTSLVKGFSAGPTDYQQTQTINKGHGRIETRRLTVTSQLQETSHWPYLAQVFRLERSTELVASGTHRGETVYGMTSLSAQQASPDRLQALVRRHWSVENELHYRRDVTFQEDATRLKAWNAAQVLAILNNLVLAVLMHVRPGTVPQARRHYAAHPDEALKLVLTAPGLS